MYNVNEYADLKRRVERKRSRGKDRIVVIVFTTLVVDRKVQVSNLKFVGQISV